MCVSVCAQKFKLRSDRPLAWFLVLTKKAAPVRLPKTQGWRWNREECVLVCICMYCVCVYLWALCISGFFLRLILTFPTGAGVNKATNHSRCGEQTWEQGRSASLQLQAAVKPSWRSQYLLSVSKPALFLYQKTRLYRSKLVHDSKRCQGCHMQKLHWCYTLVKFGQSNIKWLGHKLCV